MSNELIDYLIDHYMSLLGIKEKSAQKHHLATIKADNLEDSPLRNTILRQWGTADKEILGILDNGYEEFKKNMATKILNEYRDKVFINLCQKCQKLARTPLAKQCRFCGHDWH